MNYYEKVRFVVQLFFRSELLHPCPFLKPDTNKMSKKKNLPSTEVGFLILRLHAVAVHPPGLGAELLELFGRRSRLKRRNKLRSPKHVEIDSEMSH